MEWGASSNLNWLWVIPTALIVFYAASFRKKARMKRFGDVELIQRLTTSFNPVVRFFKRILIITAMLCLVLALAQPHFKKKEIEVERKGVDVMIVLDVSNSMLAKDIAPTRLDKAKLELAALIDRLKQDRIGIVAFAGEAFIQCPLTLDKSAVKLFLLSASPNAIPTPGTAIGSAIRVATQAFSEKDKEFKAIILLTDGEDHNSNPREMAKKAKQAGVKIFAIGIGTSDGSTIPARTAAEGFKKDKEGRVVLSKLDEGLLRDIAQETGGVYYRSSRGEVEVDSIVREIRSMSQKNMKTEKTVEYEESFQFFLGFALILLFVEQLLSERKKEKESVDKKSKHKNLTAAAFVILSLPFLCGFNFYSTLKNEQGNENYQKGRLGKAKTAYEKALKSEPSSPEIAFNLGNAYYKEESFDKSLETYKKAAQAEKTPALQAKAFYNLGNALFRKNELEKAAEFYKQALRLNPKDEDAKYNLELLMKRQNEDKKDDQKQDQKKDQNKDQSQDQQQDQNKDQNQGQNKDQGQNQDQNKDQGQDQQQDQNQDQNQDQKDKEDKQDSQDGQGGQGQDQKEQEDQKGGGSEEGEKKPDQSSESQESKDSKGQDQSEEAGQPKESDESKDSEEKGDKEGSKGQGEDGEKNSEKLEEEQGSEAGAEAGDEEAGQDKPKTAEDIRADQILNAIENQEKQILRLQAGGGQKNQARRPVYVEKDW